MLNSTRTKISSYGESRILILIILVLVAGDVLLRTLESDLSGDARHIAEFTDLALPHNDIRDFSLLFLGNSLTNNGFDATLIRNSLEIDSGIGNTVNKMVPDATAIWDWRCILQRHFISRDFAPDVVVIGFGWTQLSDQWWIEASKLGAYFCSFTSFSDILDFRSLSFAELSEFMLSKVIRVYAQRETIRNRTLSDFIPYYQEMTQHSNRLVPDTSSAATQSNLTYSALRDLISMLEGQSSMLVVVAMPFRDTPFELDRYLLSILSEEGVPFLDYQELSGLERKHFLDEIHLNGEGSRLLTTQLASDLHALLQAR